MPPGARPAPYPRGAKGVWPQNGQRESLRCERPRETVRGRGRRRGGAVVTRVLAAALTAWAC